MEDCAGIRHTATLSMAYERVLSEGKKIIRVNDVKPERRAISWLRGSCAESFSLITPDLSARFLSDFRDY